MSKFLKRHKFLFPSNLKFLYSPCYVLTVTEALFSSLFSKHVMGFNHIAYNQIDKKCVSKIPRLLENISLRKIFLSWCK